MPAAIALHLVSQLMRYRHALQIRGLNPSVIVMVTAQIHTLGGGIGLLPFPRYGNPEARSEFILWSQFAV